MSKPVQLEFFHHIALENEENYQVLHIRIATIKMTIWSFASIYGLIGETLWGKRNWSFTHILFVSRMNYTNFLLIFVLGEMLLWGFSAIAWRTNGLLSIVHRAAYIYGLELLYISWNAKDSLFVYISKYCKYYMKDWIRVVV